MAAEDLELVYTEAKDAMDKSLRGLRMDLPHRLAGVVPQVGTPLKFSATPLAYDRAPPLLGEHTSAVLRERLGLSDARIADLAARQVIQVRDEGPA
jgi:formyl-CoA transferase